MRAKDYTWNLGPSGKPASALARTAELCSQSHAAATRMQMVVSISWESFLGCPYDESSAIWGLCWGSSQIGFFQIFQQDVPRIIVEIPI